MNERDFQREAKEALLQGRSIVIVAPTGLGKTRAALDPFLASKNGNPLLTTRLIYTLPLRSLAGSIADQFKELAGDIEPTIHHGDEPESEFFSERAVITTVDQYFTAFAGAPLSWASHLSHAAAGAILTSFSVFDEVHLLSPRIGLQMLFAMLRLRHRWGLQSCVMTATLPKPAVDFFDETCGLKVVHASKKDSSDRDSWRKVRLQLDAKRESAKETTSEKSKASSSNTFEWDDKSPEGIANLLKEKWDNWKELDVDGPRKIIVFLNTVERAIDLYEELSGSFKSICPNIVLAHSRFTKDHRKHVEEKIKTFFGKDASSNDEAILVTTQVAEAGLNISAPLLITELCPIDSLIQRVGRCQRFPLKESGKEVKGLAIVVKPKTDGNNKGKWHAPYFDSFLISVRKEKAKQNKQAWIPIAEVSRTCLEKHFGASGNNNVLNWQKEQDLIDEALSEPFDTILSNAPCQLSEENLKERSWGDLFYQISKTKRDKEDQNVEEE